jgi:hypothetical protein
MGGEVPAVPDGGSMSSVDTAAAEIEVAADPTDVAAVMFDPARAPDWMQAVARVELVDAALVPGARVRYHGQVGDQQLTWTTAVDAVHFPHVLVLRIAEGPLAGIIRFDIQRSGGGSRVRIRQGAGPGAVGAGHASAAARGTVSPADLGRLRALVER